MASSCQDIFVYEQKEHIWRLWKSGASVSDIARALEVPGSRIHYVLSGHGGIAPQPRKRSGRQLRMDEREEISRGLAAGQRPAQIAARLGRNRSTVSREIARNGGRAHYRACQAEQMAWDRAARPKPCLLKQRPWLQELVAQKLTADWSPEQISCWLKKCFPEDRSRHVSHETIYRTLFVQARGALRQELIAHLRYAGRLRRPKGVVRSTGLRGKIVDAVSISERPPEVEDRAVPGHWEGDLLCGSANSYVATLVERQTRFLMLVKVPGKDTASVVFALSKQVRKLPQQLRRSLTWDRGHEMTDHKAFTLATDMQVYFCDPQSPWQRGSNENTNGLLRQYLPKRTSLSGYSQAELDTIALSLNTRPRKTLDFDTPAERLRLVLR